MSRATLLKLISNDTGLSEDALNAAWPTWWSDEAEGSPSVEAELKFSLARKLGLDPTSLISDRPKFLWTSKAKFKSYTGTIPLHSEAISSFGISISKMLFKALDQRSTKQKLPSAAELRKAILNKRPNVGLLELLSTMWGLGVPVVHLRVYPLKAKRMCAMAVNYQDQGAILLAKDAKYPAQIAFYLAHEIGHLALGHVSTSSALVDIDDPSMEENKHDVDEVMADKYALELLTGDPDFEIIKEGGGTSSTVLAREVFKISAEYSIEPGVIAMCYGHRTKEWDVVNAAIKKIYERPLPVWKVVNDIAFGQLRLTNLNNDNSSFLKAVMGG